MPNIGNAMSHSLFISDLHLCISRPNITQAFIKLLKNQAPAADALYILGDFFEYWAGDDDINNPDFAEIIDALRTLSFKGTPIFLMHGNRDFLIAEKFASTSHVSLIADPTLLELYGKKVLLSHGDSLCTDDISYQAFRKQVRGTEWQQHFLNQPLEQRKSQIESLRKRSELEKSGKSESIMDVNAEAVVEFIRHFQHPDIFIHGHTHRPGKHIISADNKITERWVLADWYGHGSYLKLSHSGCEAINL